MTRKRKDSGNVITLSSGSRSITMTVEEFDRRCKLISRMTDEEIEKLLLLTRPIAPEEAVKEKRR